MQIETDRLILRPFTREDALALHTAVYGDDEVMAYLPGGRARSLEQTRTVIEYLLDHWQQHGYGAWAVTLKAGGAVGSANYVIGQCGLRLVEELRDVEVFYALARNQWGKGYAVEAARASLRYGFTTLKLGRIVALVAPENAASQRVAARLGMRFRRDVKLFKMKLKIYAITRDEFKSDGAAYMVIR